jgi:hypothetical protein
MTLYRELLSRPRLSVISAESDPELARTAQRIAASVRVAGQSSFEQLVNDLLCAWDGAAPIAPKTLDLFGHSTAANGLLRLGDWVIDAEDAETMAFLRGLAVREVMPRLGIRAVRLLACSTAVSPRGRATICDIANVVGVEVFGTKQLLYDEHHDEHGFRDAWSFLLVSASELRGSASQARWTADPARVLDVVALPSLPLVGWASRAPRRFATPNIAHAILQLIRRDAGARMPGPLPEPSYEIALPSARPDTYHIAHVLFDSAFLQLYPDGASSPGTMYPVDDARALRRLVDELPMQAVNRW